MDRLRIGCGAGFAGDRIDPAVDLVERGRLDYLVFECLAERTIALAQVEKLSDPSRGYDPLLEARFRAVLPGAHLNRTRVITNMGAANPLAAAEKVAAIAAELQCADLRIAAVTGDDVKQQILDRPRPLLDRDGTTADIADQIVSANAYLGAGPIIEALRQDATVVITGRVADPALFLAPLMHEFSWSPADWVTLGRGTVTGHLMECAGQITGGYFADPGFKDVTGLARLGFPICEVEQDGSAEITKLSGTGGLVSLATCKEQLLYEVHDPSRYIQPDVVADFTSVALADAGTDRVRVTGGSGKPKTGFLKVSVGYRDGFIGEGQISYAGAGALGRAQLARDIIRERLAMARAEFADLRFDLLGVNALHAGATPMTNAEPYEVRLRVAGRSNTRSDAQRIGLEVEALYTNGPAGGGGVFKSIKENIAIASVLIEEELAQPRITILPGVAA